MPGAAHIAEVMTAVRRRILEIEPLFDPVTFNVEIGNPAQFHPRTSLDSHLVTIFLYRIKQDHAAMLSTPRTGLAVQLKVLITAFGGRPSGVTESIGTVELRILSHILRLFVEQPTLGPIRAPDTPAIGTVAPFVTEGITVEAQHLELDMEEINHIWTTQGETPFRTSLSYVFKYAVVLPEMPSDEGPPVLAVESEAIAEMPPIPVPEALNYGALAFRVAGAGGVELHPSLTVVSGGGGSIAARLLLVTETAEPFDLAIDLLDPSDGSWGPAPGAGPATIGSVERTALDPSALPVGTEISFDDPNPATGAVAVVRLSVTHPTDPGDWRIGAVTLVITATGGGP
jgi:hypothetical protein